MFSCTKIFSEKEECDIVDTMYKLMCDYIDENPTKISEPDFNDEMMSRSYLSVRVASGMIFFLEETKKWTTRLKN